MSTQFYSVQMSLTDGLSSLSLAYAVSINTAILREGYIQLNEYK